jgi:hypothetical protein
VAQRSGVLQLACLESRVSRMDFIDRWLGLAPDSAGRVVELLMLIVLTSVIIGFILYFFRDHDL